MHLVLILFSCQKICKRHIRPSPHQQQCRSNRQHCRSYVRLCRSNINIRLCCHKRQQCRPILLQNFVLSTKSNVASTLLPFLATMSNGISSFRQSRNKLNINGSIVAGNCQHCCQKTANTSKQRSTLSKESFNL